MPRAGMVRRLSALRAALPLIIRAIVSAGLILLLGWVLGWQNQLGRLDPAFVIPWMLPVLLWRAWRLRHTVPSRRMDEAALTLIMLVTAQAALTLSSGAVVASVAAHLFAVTIAYLSCAAICQALAQIMRRHAVLRWGVPLASAVLWLVAAHLLLSWAYTPAAAQRGAKPAVMVTGLPLRWAGSADFADILSGESGDDIFLSTLEGLGPISLVDSLTDQPRVAGATWVLAHPRALAPQDMVAVDRHVRGGGRALIFADALSSWPAAHGFGDPRNAPITSLLTPLLDHWGVKLSAVAHGQGGEQWLHMVDAGVGAGVGAGLRLHSAGRFARWPSTCVSIGQAYALRCKIGRGEVVLVGDADLLYAPLWQPNGWDAAHLMKSDILPWAAGQIWGGEAGQAYLKPIWVSEPRRLDVSVH